MRVHISWPSLAENPNITCTPKASEHQDLPLSVCYTILRIKLLNVREQNVNGHTLPALYGKRISHRREISPNCASWGTDSSMSGSGAEGSRIVLCLFQGIRKPSPPQKPLPADPLCRTLRFTSTPVARTLGQQEPASRLAPTRWVSFSLQHCRADEPTKPGELEGEARPCFLSPSQLGAVVNRCENNQETVNTSYNLRYCHLTLSKGPTIPKRPNGESYSCQ
jgi:hypothetical protein